MTYFTEVKTVDELKSEFKRLAKQYHPDKGGCVEAMKAINAQYKEILECLLKGQDFFGEGLKEKLEEDKVLMAKVMDISALDDIEIEICGSWIWLTGDTKKHKTVLKEKGFKWARRKESWYFHEGDYRRRGKKVYSLDEIRGAHGSTRINKSKYKRAKIA